MKRYNAFMRFFGASRVLHRSWLVMAGLTGCVMGLAAAPQSWAHWAAHGVWWGVGLGLIAICLALPRRYMIVGALIGGSLIGLARGTNNYAISHAVQPLVGSTVTLRGVVMEDVEQNQRGESLLRLKNIHINGTHWPSVRVWGSVGSETSIKRSDIVTLQGKLSTGFGDFSASIYRAEIKAVERPEPGDVALKLRDAFAESVRASTSEPASSLGLGYLTGQRRTLPDDLQAALQSAGLMHIVVASGYNLTILVRLARRLFVNKSRFVVVYVSALLVITFIAITGMSPSMSRAGLVAGLSIGAWYLGRKFHPLMLLLIAAAVTGMLTPSYVWGSLGWQLSFAAFAGVMIVAPLLQAYFFGERPPGLVRQILGETISAQLVTAPLLLHAFGALSNVAVIANGLILPFVPLAMALTFLTGVAGFISGQLAAVIALPTQWLLDAMVGVAMWAGNLEWAMSEYELSFTGVVVCFMVLIGACVWMQRATGYRLRDSNIVE